MIDLKAVAAELESARLARRSAEAASADIEEMMQDMQRAAFRQAQLQRAVAEPLRLAS